MWRSPELAEIYPRYLCTMHTVVRSSVPLMESALAAARALADQDPVAHGVAEYLEGHISEEKGHDRWILEDLEALGHDPERALRDIPSPRVAAVVGAQYYWLRHYHPVALLGHIAVMEGFPPGPDFARRLQERTGFPREAFRSVARHARLDVRHRDELYQAIDRLPMKREHEVVLGISGLHTVSGFVEVFEELLASSSSALADTAG